ncbi:hypothetical protein [Sandaracinus amylolyticus]|uniref:hypothetical protein n=1 Tax=Sandaracinus amylolyticus TaxID=927083 RepID=UPI001F19BAC4|nr:hypothetical protein [Sandaracinus amylolyticus]
MTLAIGCGGRAPVPLEHPAPADAIRVELSPLRVTRFREQEWMLANRGATPITVGAWRGALSVIDAAGEARRHYQSICSAYDDAEVTVAPGESTTVREPPSVGYAPLGAGRYRFAVEVGGANKARALAEVDFDFGALSPREIVEAHERVQDASLEACGWYPRYVGCVVEATPPIERAAMVRALAARGPATLGAVAQALAYVDDDRTVGALLGDEHESLRLTGAVALLQLRWAARFPELDARHDDALALVTHMIAAPGATSVAVLLAADGTAPPPPSLHDAWIARLAHEEDPVHLAWIALRLSSDAWTSALHETRRVATIEAFAAARVRVPALREGALGAFSDQVASVLADPRPESAPPLDSLLSERDDARGDTTSTQCVDRDAIVTRTLEGCRAHLWMRATITTTRITAAPPS